MARSIRSTPTGGRLAGAAVLGYLTGAVPVADLAARLAGGGADLRSAGSGNPGAANAMAVLGPRWGYAVLVADVAKGAVASAAGRRVAGDLGAHVGGTAAVAGHCWPVTAGFKGGKGVAASVGQCLVTFPAYFPIDLAVAGLTSASPRWRRRAMAATAVASTCWVASGVVWWRRSLPNAWGPRPTPALPAAAAVSSALILHRFLLARRSAGEPPPGAREPLPVPLPARVLDDGEAVPPVVSTPSEDRAA
jgi:glycerol-3-phosphate acyltransferase PlsY